MQEQSNLDKVRQVARDLRRQEPRPANQEVAGFPMAARTLDKCRASLLGWEGDYTFGCPMDRQFFAEAGIAAAEFKAFVATGATDNDVETWLKDRARKF
jgi:uncharacterized protein DUF5069